MSELLPCPFCGALPWASCNYVTCSGCGARVTSTDSAKYDAWNRRAPQWQPIATAPKQQRVVVSYLSKQGIRRTALAVYYEAGTLDWDESNDHLYEEGEEHPPEGWYEDCYTQEQTLPLECAPTHWQLLPENPKG